MAARTGIARRTGTALRWPVGMGLASWRYLWRTRALHRDDAPGGAQDGPPSYPDVLVDERTQLPQDGAGAFFHRRYGVHIENTPLSADQLMARITGNLNAASPVEVAVFDKTQGSEGDVCIGDEYVVRMPGPWDGPVRVIDRTATSFRLATLHGHLEAGQIEFRVRADPADGPGGAAALRFEIESWARSGDRLSDLLYDRVRLAKEMQLHMWCHFCERVAVLAGGRIRGGIDVRTRRVDAAAVPALLA